MMIYVRSPDHLPLVGDHLVLATGRLVRVVSVEMTKIEASPREETTPRKASTNPHQRGFFGARQVEGEEKKGKGRTPAHLYTLECLEDGQRWEVTQAIARVGGRLANGLGGAAILDDSSLDAEIQAKRAKGF
jgi:hypothetical protein